MSETSIILTKHSQRITNKNLIKCPECKNTSIIKNGLKHNKKTLLQRYICNVCSRRFTKLIKKNSIDPINNIPKWANKSYDDYSKYSMPISKVCLKYNKSYKTLIKYFNLIEKNKAIKNHQTNYKEYHITRSKYINFNEPELKSILLTFDGTFFK